MPYPSTKFLKRTVSEDIRFPASIKARRVSLLSFTLKMRQRVEY